jgi:hypothetical protein
LFGKVNIDAGTDYCLLDPLFVRDALAPEVREGTDTGDVARGADEVDGWFEPFEFRPRFGDTGRTPLPMLEVVVVGVEVVEPFLPVRGELVPGGT